MITLDVDIESRLDWLEKKGAITPIIGRNYISKQMREMLMSTIKHMVDEEIIEEKQKLNSTRGMLSPICNLIAMIENGVPDKSEKHKRIFLNEIKNIKGIINKLAEREVYTDGIKN